MNHAAHWTYVGLREAGTMVWMTWWPLVFGFTLSGLVQSFLPRDGLRRQLGATNATSLTKASLLGVISSSCSYAASAMARALFARGASWTNSVIFMVASTNLVIELGVVLYLLLGWQFVVAQIVGGENTARDPIREMTVDISARRHPAPRRPRVLLLFATLRREVRRSGTLGHAERNINVRPH
jgi:hypothetical protein